MFGLRNYGATGDGTRKPRERTVLTGNVPAFSLDGHHEHYHRAVLQHVESARAIQRASYAPYGWGEDARLRDGWANADQCMPFDDPPQIKVQQPYIVGPINW